LNDLMTSSGATKSPEARIIASQGATVTEDPAWDGDLYSLLQKHVSDFEDAETTSAQARELAERDRDYVDGFQFTAEELAVFRRRRQPPIYNNVIARKVALLRGIERRGRSDPEAYPRTPTENVRADAATQALRFVSDENRFDVIRSSVYDQMMVEGFSGAEIIVEEQSDGDGYDVVINHVPFERLYFDPHSQKAGFQDAMFLGCVIWMDRDDALDMYPGCGDILDATLSNSRGDTYDDKPRTTWGDNKRRRVRVIQHHWKKRSDWWVATLTQTGFLAEPMLSPYKDRHGNRSCPLILRSARVDRQNNRMGIVRDMIPLQDEINKRRSKLLHALSVNRIIMESGAVDDVDQTRNEAAKPDGVIVTNRGFEFRIEKDEAEIQGQMHLLQDAVEQMNVTGPNASMAGKDPREQSGRAILAQQSGGMIENEPLTDELRQWNHKVMEAAWCRIRQFWTAERWIRVTDDDKNTRFVGINHPVTIADLLGKLDQTQPIQAQIASLPQRDAQAVQIGLQMQPNDPRLQMVVRIENDINDMDVSITVEEGPDNPTMAAEQFQMIMSLPPIILQNFPPEFFIKASSLRNKDALIKMIEEHQAQQANNAQGAQAMQAAQIAKVQADAKDKNASALERMHSVASDHAVMPHQNALMAAQAAGAQANTLNTIHGIAMDHAAAAQPAPAEQPLAPTGPDPMALQAAAHGQDMDRAQLALQAQAQAHDQDLAMAQHALAVKQANRPAPRARA
jgi:hypothetical protein